MGNIIGDCLGAILEPCFEALCPIIGECFQFLFSGIVNLITYLCTNICFECLGPLFKSFFDTFLTPCFKCFSVICEKAIEGLSGTCNFLQKCFTPICHGCEKMCLSCEKNLCQCKCNFMGKLCDKMCDLFGFCLEFSCRVIGDLLYFILEVFIESIFFMLDVLFLFCRLPLATWKCNCKKLGCDDFGENRRQCCAKIKRSGGCFFRCILCCFFQYCCDNTSTYSEEQKKKEDRKKYLKEQQKQQQMYMSRQQYLAHPIQNIQLESGNDLDVNHEHPQYNYMAGAAIAGAGIGAGAMIYHNQNQKQGLQNNQGMGQIPVMHNSNQNRISQYKQSKSIIEKKQFISLNYGSLKINIELEKYGSNPNQKLLIVQSGFLYNRQILRNFIEPMMNQNIEVYGFDIQELQKGGVWNLQKFVQVIEFIRVQLKFNSENFFLLGHQLGGVIATEYSLQYQYNLKGLIVSNMMMSIPQLNDHIKNKILPSIYNEKQLSSIENFEMGKEPAFQEQYENDFKSYFLPNFVHHNQYVNWQQQLKNSFDIKLRDQKQFHMFGVSQYYYLGQISEWDATTRLSQLNIPAFFIAGKNDFMDYNHIQNSSQQVQKGSFQLCQNSGSFSYIDDQLHYFQGLINFINQNSQQMIVNIPIPQMHNQQQENNQQDGKNIQKDVQMPINPMNT